MGSTTAVIDAHHHLWDPAARPYPWMDEEVLAPLRRRYDLHDLAAATATARVGAGAGAGAGEGEKGWYVVIWQDRGYERGAGGALEIQVG